MLAEKNCLSLWFHGVNSNPTSLLLERSALESNMIKWASNDLTSVFQYLEGGGGILFNVSFEALEGKRKKIN